MARENIPERPTGYGAPQPIAHFDATERRKEKMRLASGQREAPRPATNRADARANGAAPSLGRPVPTAANGAASELDAFLIELQQYLGASPAGSLARYPTLSRVARFLQEAPDPVERTSGLPARADAHETDTTAAGPVPAGTTVGLPTEQPPPGFEPAAPAAEKQAVLADAQALEAFMIDFVVEQTGYPREVVELDADLEADLGIDSIKKAQLFAELRDYFEISPNISRTDLTLDDFPTLRHVVDFIRKAGPQAAKAGNEFVGAQNGAGPGAACDAIPSSAVTRHETEDASADRAAPGFEPAAPAREKQAVLADAQALEAFMIDFVVEQTGYPREVVELDADLEADLGIDSIKKAQLFAELRDYFEISPNISRTDLTLDDFPTLRHVVDFIRKAGPRAASAGNESDEFAGTEPAYPSAQPGSPHEPEPRPEPDGSLAALERLIVEKGIIDSPPPRFTRDTRLIDDLGLDSVAILKLATAVEKKFLITLELHELSLSVLNSAGAFAALIDEKLAARH